MKEKVLEGLLALGMKGEVTGGLPTLRMQKKVHEGIPAIGFRFISKSASLVKCSSILLNRWHLACLEGVVQAMWNIANIADIVYNAPPCTALHCTALHLYSTVLHWTWKALNLNCTELALHYTSLHCTEPHFLATYYWIKLVGVTTFKPIDAHS